jgi:hypothetical protein
MTRSAKLGLTSIALLVAAQFLLKPLDGLVGFLLLFFSCLFGIIAARTGSRWWLVVPVLVLLLVSFLVWLVLHIR